MFISFPALADERIELGLLASSFIFLMVHTIIKD